MLQYAALRSEIDLSVELNHTIVWCRDKHESAKFFSEIFGLAAPKYFGHFMIVETSNGVSLDFAESDDEIASQHYAFLISEDEFDQVFERITEKGISYWADPAKRRLNKINQNDGGRGMYFHDPDGHFLEVITRPYGGSV
jgi:catechol 2,3-dioxygenase-like lactoylglutathione lyase family enzyme